MTILIDVDNVFWNFVETILSKLNSINKTNYKLSDVSYWEWLPEHFNEPFSITETKEFWNDVQPYPHAVEIIKQFVEQGHDVVFVTASGFTKGLHYKIHHLLSFFDHDVINEDNVIIAKSKYHIFGTVLIDDGMHNLEEYTGLTIRYMQPWNHPSPKCDYSANGWLGIKDLIQYIDYNF